MAIEMPGSASIQDALELLAARYYTDGKSEIWDAEHRAFRIPVIVMTDSRDVVDYSMVLEDGQEIMLVAPMSGG
jgi:molybdopterin converting factor small subunit